MSMLETPPVPTADRLDLLDALRGFALLGILLANVLAWSGWLMVDDAAKAAWAGKAAALRARRQLGARAASARLCAWTTPPAPS